MRTVKVPTLQHLARNWQHSPDRIAKQLVNLANNPPIFNYSKLLCAVEDMLVFGQPYEEIVVGIKRAEKRKNVQQNLLSVLSLLRDFFDGSTPDFVQRVDRRHYPVAQGLMVPFDPPLIYGIDGRLIFPWFSFWRSNPLSGANLQLFATVVREILNQDPDLEEARFDILDFSAPRYGEPRELRVIDADAVPRLPEDRKVEMLSVFADGYFRAREILREDAYSRSQDETQPSSSGNPEQPGFFDNDF